MKKRLFTGTAGVLIIAAAVASLAVLQKVRARASDDALEVSGRIEGEEVVINSKIGGRVQQLLVREGDQVTRGQLVAILNADELDAKVRQAAAQVDALQAQTLRAEGEIRVLEWQLTQAGTGVSLTETQVGAQRRQAQAALSAASARLTQARTASSMAQVQVPSVVEEARAMLRAAEADLARARVVSEEARRNLARFEALYATGAIAAVDVEAARTRADVANTQVEAATEQVQRARATAARAEAGTLEIQVREEDVRGAAAQVEAARSQVTLANAGPLEVARQRAQHHGVAQQVEIARAGLASVRAQLQAAIAARDELQILRNEARVLTPLSGVVSNRVVNAGEVIPAGTPLVVVVDLRALWLKVFLPGPDIGRLRLGMAARVSVDAFPGRVFPAKIVEISQRAEFTPKDVQTREERVKQVFAVKLAVDNADGALKPGMPADALILWKGEGQKGAAR